MSEVKKDLNALGCTELSYRFTVPVATFDIEAFTKAIGPFVDSNGWHAIRRFSVHEDYHIHVYWKHDDSNNDDPPKTKLQVDFHVWRPDWIEKYNVPAADEFFQWAAQFFATEKATAHIHVEFEFSNDKWESKIMRLPIEIPYAGKTASIQGLSIRLPLEPGGVRDVWISRGKHTITTTLYADRLIEFKTFTPFGDVTALLAVARSLMEEKQNE